MKGKVFSVGNVNTRQVIRVHSENTKNQSTKGRSSSAVNVNYRLLQREILLHTKNQYTKGRSSSAGNVNTRQHIKLVIIIIINCIFSNVVRNNCKQLTIYTLSTWSSCRLLLL